MINIINELKEEVQRILNLNPNDLKADEILVLEVRAQTLSEVICTLESIKNTGEISDGYHTFNELYHHRAVLFSVICNMMPDKAWKSKLHDTGDMYDGMFIVGIETPDGQATYHYDINPYWDMFKVKELDKAPKWDGHTPAEAIERIGAIEPKKGKWEVCGDYEYICEINDSVYVPSYQCSECCEEFPKAYNYCPNCGADMREE